MFTKILVANRGEIARRIMRTARGMGVASVAIYSEADRSALHVAEADEAYCVGAAAPQQSYLQGGRVIDAALQSGAQAIHPGYGFLSENADFARRVMAAGLTWIGPDPQLIDALGDKVNARNLMSGVGFPVNPGGLAGDAAAVEALVDEIGLPVMVKAAAGGGGIGMKVVHRRADLWPACERASQQAARLFGDPTLLIERFMEGARHVEVQILGLNSGEVLALGDRDCSVQRRFQKIVEESPSPGVSQKLRAHLLEASASSAEALGYRGAGTIECLVRDDEFVFLEVNARLQVEHPVTEMVTGLDLVEAQLHIAANEPWQPPNGRVEAHGHAIELRIYAEDPRTFLPAPGLLSCWREPVGEGVRVDSGYQAGDTVTPFYDPLLAKLCVHGADRPAALSKARHAVRAFEVEGPKTNLPFLAELLNDSAFRNGDYDTGFVSRMQQAKAVKEPS